MGKSAFYLPKNVLAWVLCHLVGGTPNSEKMTIEIDLDGQKFIGGIYSHMPEQKYKAYFDSKVEEAFPRMIKAYENYKNRSRFQKLFKGE